MDPRNSEQATTNVQNAHTQAQIGLAMMIAALVRAFGKKGKKESTIEIKVDGKTKLKGKVENGQFKPSINKLTPEEVRTLQEYFKTVPNPPIKPQDFQVMVDGETVLQTKDGNVVKRSTVKDDVFNEAKWVSAPKQPAPTHYEKTHSVPVPDVKAPVPLPASQQTEWPKAEPIAQRTEPVSKTEPLPSSVVEPALQQTESPKVEPSPAPVVEPAPKNLNTVNGKVSAATEKVETPLPVDVPAPNLASDSSSEKPLPEPFVESRKSISTGEIPSDFGLPAAKNINREAVLATGDQTLIMQHSRLEGERTKLNSELSRSKDPGMQHLASYVSKLRSGIETALPDFERRLETLTKEGKYKIPAVATVEPVQPSSSLQQSQTENNRDLVNSSRLLLKTTNGKPKGDREYTTGDYKFKETNGDLSVTHKTRGVILETKGNKYSGSATLDDLRQVTGFLATAQTQKVKKLEAKPVKTPTPPLARVR
jgi:hypothetical protein